jgi:hypothetical protein
MGSEQKAKYPRSLAVSVRKVSRQNTNEASRLCAAAKRIQIEATNLSAKAKELTMQAANLRKKAEDNLPKKPADNLPKNSAESLPEEPAAQDISASLLQQLKDLRQERKRLRKAIRNEKPLAELAGEVRDMEQSFKLALEDFAVSAELQNQCNQELGNVALALADAKSKLATNTSNKEAPKNSTAPEMQKQREENTDADELQIIDDTVELRALFERKADERRRIVAQSEPQCNTGQALAELEGLDEQQILTELWISAPVPSCTQREPGQRGKLNAAGALSQPMSEQERQLEKYRPTSHDVARGLRWTLRSSETVRQNLNEEINEGGTQPYISGHIAVMHRKVAILRYFAQEHGVPSAVIEGELTALQDAISKAEPLAKPGSVQEADEYLRHTDYRNTVPTALRFEGAQTMNTAMREKRKYEDDAARANIGDSDHLAMMHRDKRRRMNHSWSKPFDAIHAGGQSNQGQAPIHGGGASEMLRDPGPPGFRSCLWG